MTGAHANSSIHIRKWFSSQTDAGGVKANPEHQNIWDTGNCDLADSTDMGPKTRALCCEDPSLQFCLFRSKMTPSGPYPCVLSHR